MMRPLSTNPPPDLDPDLIPRLRRGDAIALTAIYQSFGPELLAVAARLTGSAADAEDILHDLIVGLPEAMRNYDERGKLRAWLRQVVVRMALMRLRAARRRHETALGEARELLAPANPSRDTNDAVEIAIRELSPAIRTVVVLRLFEDLSHREIAEMLGISVSASEARLSRGIAVLRRRLESLI
jgi:RNA polymerase sigma-70 factor, ECF subfamily